MTDDDALAQHCHRLAVLIAAGLSPAAAWEHVAKAAEPVDTALSAIAMAAAAGTDPADAIISQTPQVGAESATTVNSGADTRGWAVLAAAWRVASAAGAPLAPALRAYAEALRDRSAAERDIAVALAGPRATTRIVLMLPFAAVLLGLLMGVDLLATVTSPVGALCLLMGLALIIVARRWMRWLLAAARPIVSTSGPAFDLLAIAAAGGGPPETAADRVQHELERVGLPVDRAPIDALVRLSRHSGAPLGELARSEAVQVRARERSGARIAAEDLAVRLMVPLGACVLPSFVLVGVVPMLLGLLSSTVRVF